MAGGTEVPGSTIDLGWQTPAFGRRSAGSFIVHTAPALALSAAALGAVNGWGHVAGTIRGRRYVPGAVTGLLVYQPVAVFAYLQFERGGLLTVPVLFGSLLLGAAYHLVPLGYFATRRLIRVRSGAGSGGSGPPGGPAGSRIAGPPVDAEVPPSAVTRPV